MQCNFIEIRLWDCLLVGIATLFVRKAFRTAQRKGEVITTGYTLELGGPTLPRTGGKSTEEKTQHNVYVKAPQHITIRLCLLKTTLIAG